MRIAVDQGLYPLHFQFMTHAFFDPRWCCSTCTYVASMTREAGTGS